MAVTEPGACRFTNSLSTDKLSTGSRSTGSMAIPLSPFLLLAPLNHVHSAVLPKDRVDLLYHSDDGGGVAISGPSLLVRKELANKVSLSANYHVGRVTGASIADLFPYYNAQNFLARDKELSMFKSVSYGFGITYEIQSSYLSAFEKTTANLFWDHLVFDYDNFRHVLATGYAQGEEPLYRFNADVKRLFISFSD